MRYWRFESSRQCYLHSSVGPERFPPEEEAVGFPSGDYALRLVANPIADICPRRQMDEGTGLLNPHREGSNPSGDVVTM